MAAGCLYVISHLTVLLCGNVGRAVLRCVTLQHIMILNTAREELQDVCLECLRCHCWQPGPLGWRKETLEAAEDVAAVQELRQGQRTRAVDAETLAEVAATDALGAVAWVAEEQLWASSVEPRLAHVDSVVVVLLPLEVLKALLLSLEVLKALPLSEVLEAVLLSLESWEHA